MSVDKTNVLIYFEEDIEELFNHLSMDEEDVETITLAKVGLKKDRSQDNIRKETIVIQKIIDKYILDVGETSELLIVQGRLNQIRSLYEIVDVFDVEE